MKLTGIYKISNPEGHVYIGRSRDIARRFYEYKANEGKKNKRPVEASINFFGVSAHSFEIVSLLPNDVSNDVIHAYEEFYWQMYKNAGFSMLNAMTPGKGINKHSEETREKISQAGIGRKPTLGMKFGDKTKKLVSEAVKRMWAENPLLGSKPVYQFTKDGVFVKKWDSVTIAAKAMNRDKASISQVACGIRNCKTSAGFVWRFNSPE